MKRGLEWGVRSTILGCLVVLGATACGRDRNAVLVIWEASGVEVTRLDLPLAGALHTFTVREYVLEGRERSGKTVREFRDRALLTADVLGHDGRVFGYVNRTYADGDTVALRLSGSTERLAGGRDEASVLGRVIAIGSDGGLDNRLVSLSRFEMRLDPVGGRISAKGS